MKGMVCSIFVLLIFAVSAVAEQAQEPAQADFVKRMLAVQPELVLGWGDGVYKLNEYKSDATFFWVAVRDVDGCLVFSFEYWILDVHRRRINAVKLNPGPESFVRAWNAVEVNDLARAETRAEVRSNGTCGKEIDLRGEVDKFNRNFSSFMVLRIAKKP